MSSKEVMASFLAMFCRKCSPVVLALNMLPRVAKRKTTAVPTNSGFRNGVVLPPWSAAANLWAVDEDANNQFTQEAD